MIIDTSAVIAILFAEPDAEKYAQAIAIAESCRMSAATLVETSIVTDVQTKNAGSRQLDAFIRRAGIAIEPVTEEHTQIARQAYADFGARSEAAQYSGRAVEREWVCPFSPS